MRIRLWLWFLMLISVPALSQKLPVPELRLPEPSDRLQPQSSSTVLSAPPSAPPPNMPLVKLSARLEPLKIYQGEVFDYLIELSWEKSKESCELEFKLPLIPAGENIKAVGSEFESENFAKAETEKVKRIYHFKYFPMKPGTESIGQADFEYRCWGTEQWYKVSAPAVPVEVFKRPLSFKRIVKTVYFRVVLLLLFFSALGSGAFLLIRARRRKREELLALAVEKSPEEKARELLRNADQFRIAGRYPDYFLGLEQALRVYLEERYSIRWSVRERLLEEVSKNISQELVGELDYFLRFSDRVKFAGEEPEGSEMDRCYQAVRRVIEYKKMEIVGGKQ